MTNQPPLDVVDFEDEFLEGPYRSETDQNIYITLVASLGFLLFVLMIAVPQVVSIYLLPTNSPFRARMGAEIPKIRAAVHWQGELWMTVLKLSPFSGQQTLLRPFPIEGQAAADRDLTLPVEIDRWVVDGHLLWGVSTDRVIRIEDRQVTLQYPKLRLNQPSKPFLRDGGIQIVARNATSNWALFKFESGEWLELGEIALPINSAPSPAMPIVPGNGQLPPAVAQQFGRIEVLGGQAESLRLLLSNGAECWISSTIPLAPPKAEEDGPVSALAPTVDSDESSSLTIWKQLTAGPKGYWEAISDGDRLYLAELQSPGLKRDITVYVADLDSEADSTSCRIHGLASGSFLESCSLVRDGDRILLVSESFPPGGIRRWSVDSSGVTPYGGSKSGSPLIQGFGGDLLKVQIVASSICTIILLAFVVAIEMLMRVYRHRQYAFGHQRVRLASFGRRAIARAVDGILTAILPTGVMVWLYLNFDLQEFIDAVLQNPFQNLIRVAYFVLAMLAYSAFSTILFGVLEGCWGWSPGKGLMGIRVMRTSLVPIGILRGILRQFLLVIDVQPNYLIGSLMIALMSKCQRLGDLATDSIVIEKPA